MRRSELDDTLTGLASRDPEVRDGRALPTLLAAVQAGLDADDAAHVAAVALERLDHPETQARTFAPLVIAALVESGRFDPTWWQRVARWWVGEHDLRGHDDGLGWLHAVAHGADLVATCAAARVVDPGDLLDATVARCIEPTDTVWRDQEDDRVAHALVQVVAHPDLTADRLVAGLSPVRRMFESGEPGPVPAPATNTMHVLRSLVVALGQQPLWDDEPVRVPLADVAVAEACSLLALVTPWSWRPA
ncbi:DUF2785 domain-containing protein [Terracoccus luteus]|uniref:DUF2785 domain-containing protein n=1 Tax=Terracoccus luteus TaxID=53356 RepID=A0A839PT96_9MICO|nr:DUF2785 domain-containing protein [Terracoccus luteus]MBB2985984.1 hypothetical protein [Terracoccus luteus]MCP2171636.1 hypothetical protein [Terracoccus luteus]